MLSALCFAQNEDELEKQAKDSIILDTLDFDLKNFRGKGELTFLSQKSKTTGGVYQTSLATGKWQFFDKKEILRVSGMYKVSGSQSLKTGRWEYFDEQEELIMVENFPPLKYSMVYLKPFVLKTEDGFDIINFNAEEELSVTHYKNPPPPMQISPVYYINYANDSMRIFNYDTMVNMDNRNPEQWMLAKPESQVPHEDNNLVDNGSFEKTDGRIASGAEVKEHITSWRSAAGTPDYYRSKKLNAQQGDAFIGARFYTEKFNHIEFIITQLKEPLEANKSYCLKMHVRLRESSFYGVNALGALLSSEIPPANGLINGTVMPILKHHKGSILAFKTKWMLMQCEYKAKGGEEYLTLGSFANSDSMMKKHLKGDQLESYYYFDNIQLFEILKPEDCLCNLGNTTAPPPPPEIELPEPKTFVIKNIFFENDKWNLLPESYTALDSLFEVLENNDFSKIEISGHTSNTGSRERNILLSKNRAEAVKKYLVGQGLPSKLFTCKGYGPDKPIANNDTEEGQAENRRVEFTIIE